MIRILRIMLLLLVGLLLAGLLLYLAVTVIAVHRHPPLQAVKEPVALADLGPASLGELPAQSESLSRAAMEPVSLVFVGPEERLDRLFTEAGWKRAEKINIVTGTHAYLAGIFGLSYPTGPAGAGYVGGRVQNVTYQRAVKSDSFRQRHHARIWKTARSYGGEPVWVATASFDRGLRLTPQLRLPTHRVDPDLNAERDYLIETLRLPAQYVQVRENTSGKLATGDHYYFDGRVAVIRL